MTTPALPPSGGTTVAARVIDIRAPDDSGTTLPLAAACARAGVSERTMQRRLADGELPGAHKVPGSRGEEWRIPVAAIEYLWPTAAQQEDAAEGGPDEQPIVNRLLDLVDDLRTDLANAGTDLDAERCRRAELETWTQSTRDADRVRMDKLQVRIDDLQSRLRMVEVEAAAARALLTRRQRRRLDVATMREAPAPPGNGGLLEANAAQA